jgi:predicted DNA-binding transcriptional regulator YafY
MHPSWGILSLMNQAPGPERDTAGQWSRLIWLDGQIREGCYPSAADLQEEFGIRRRMAFNTLAFLRGSLKAPLEYSRARRGYFYADPTYGLPAVFLREGELLALILAEQVTRQYLGTPLEEPLRGAVEKLRRYLPGKVAVEVGELARRFQIAGGSSVEVPLATLADFQRAVRERRKMRVLYYTASRDETREREIEPHFFRNVSGDWTVVAWDDWRQGPREFALSRVQEYAVLEARFQYRPELSPERYREHTFRTEHGSAGPYEVALRFDAYQARWIRERTWHPSQTVEELPDGGLLLRLTVAGEGDLVRWVLGYGCHVVVEEPAWLRERVAEELRRAAERYQDRLEPLGRGGNEGGDHV